MLKVTLSRLLAVALKMHLTLHLVLIAIGLMYQIFLRRKIYSNENQDNELLGLCFVLE